MRQASYESVENMTLFGELMFRLMPVENHKEHWGATSEANDGQVWRSDDLPEYATKIGRNTGYVIHPEEILADNFVLLVTQRHDVPDLWIVDRLGEILHRSPSPQQ